MMDPSTTIDQIGRMTLGGIGARQFVRSDDSLTFTISRGHRRVTVTLDPDDTYSVRTHMIRSGKLVYQAEGVYCDQLADAVWTAHIERRGVTA